MRAKERTLQPPLRLRKGGTSYYPLALVDANNQEVILFHAWEINRQHKAEQILKCVNLHDELVQALEKVTRCLEGWMEIQDEEDARDYDKEACDTAHALLIQAKQ